MTIPVWDVEFSNEQSLKIIADLSAAHCGRIHDEAIREGLSKAIAERRYSDLINWNVDYGSGLSVSDLIEVRQVLGFYQKLEFLDIGIDKEAAARAKFQESQELCRETNSAFSSWSAGRFYFPRGVDGILHAAQRKIQKVLGRVPAFSELDLSFGPGATTSVPRRKACVSNKLASVPSCSSNFLEVLPKFMAEVPGWVDALATGAHFDGDDFVEHVTVEIHAGILAFVLKNAKTYRTVMKEPTLNTMLQGGYGKHIAKRLRRVGQYIDDQARNQVLARQGSLTGALATLDLSSASDTISRELVYHLLPIDWYVALDACRTKTVLDDDREVPLELFSSMGNGFTFPLQTLIFWALVCACQESTDNVSVYGDDIICPVAAVPTVIKVFTACGFKVNQSKSFWSGPFRESCGADYFLGVDIRPFYQKNKLSYESLFILHNFYKRRHDTEMAALVLGYIPGDVQLWGPDGYGDGHLVGDWSPRQHKREDGWGGYLFDTYQKIGSFRKLKVGDRALPLYSIYVVHDGLHHLGSICLDSPIPQNVNYSLPTRQSVKWNKKRKAYESVLKDPLPGAQGYKRVSIYTFTR